MRVETVHIRQFRSLKDLSIELGGHTALIGANGTGKSSVLYALDWFFNGGVWSIEDLHHTSAMREAGAKVTEMDVEVTFTDLNTADRAVLGPYGRGTEARFRRTWQASDGKDKIIGNSSQGPGFGNVRVSDGIKNLREAYKQLQISIPELPDVLLKDEILAALTNWENDPAHHPLLEPVAAADATHLFGFNGENILAKRVRMILVPAAADIASQVGATGRGSALQQLLGDYLIAAVTKAREAWETANAVAIEQLADSIATEVASATALQASRVNMALARLIPNSSLQFTPRLPDPSVKADATVTTEVVIAGECKDIGRQGHGVQRAVLIAMLQALVPDQASIAATIGLQGTDDPNVATKIQEEIAKLPTLVIAIEEPEIYQHPVRARHFARVLSELATGGASQVVFATHSPYFVLPHQFESLRRFRMAAGASTLRSATVSQIVAAANSDLATVHRHMERELPHTFSEGFFADAVLLVEGDTNRVVMEAIAARLGKPFDGGGISVLAAGGKDGLRIPYEILQSLGIDVYVLADGDCLGAQRKHPADPALEANVHASHKLATDKLLSWLPPWIPVLGSLPCSFCSPTVVTSRWTVLHDDLEGELSKWPQFMSELNTIGGQLRSKNVAAYRSAALSADLVGLPSVLSDLIDAMTSFA